MASPRDIERRHQAALHAMETLRTLVHRDSLDVLLIVGDDQKEMFDLSNIPALAIYYGASIDNSVKPVTHAANWAAWFQEIVDRYLEETAPASYLCEPSLARHLIGRLIAGEFDVSGIENRAGDPSVTRFRLFIERTLETSLSRSYQFSSTLIMRPISRRLPAASRPETTNGYERSRRSWSACNPTSS